MSELWDQCRRFLQKEMTGEEWQRCIRPLETWMDSGALYLWVGRGPRDWRPIPVAAQAFDEQIREAVRAVWGRKARTVRYLTRPPNRELIISERRVLEHQRGARGREEQERQALLRYREQEYRHVKDEFRQRLATANLPELPRDEDELERLLMRMVDTRARRRLALEGTRPRRPASGGPPPDDPPLWDPAGKSRS